MAIKAFHVKLDLSKEELSIDRRIVNLISLVRLLLKQWILEIKNLRSYIIRLEEIIKSDILYIVRF